MMVVLTNKEMSYFVQQYAYLTISWASFRIYVSDIKLFGCPVCFNLATVCTGAMPFPKVM